MSDGLGGRAHLTRRWALRESLPPTEVTLQVYVPMSPDHVWEMCSVPSGSSRRRGELFTSIMEPVFSHTCLGNTHTHERFGTVCKRTRTHTDFPDTVALTVKLLDAPSSCV